MNAITTTSITPLSQSQSRRWMVWPLIVALAVIAMLWGATVAMIDTRRLIELLYSFTFAVVITLACRNDGRNRGTPVLPIFQFLMIITWPIAVPIYLVWTRKWLGLLLSFLYVTGFLIAFYIPAIAVLIARSR